MVLEQLIILTQCNTHNQFYDKNHLVHKYDRVFLSWQHIIQQVVLHFCKLPHIYQIIIEHVIYASTVQVLISKCWMKENIKVSFKYEVAQSVMKSIKMEENLWSPGNLLDFNMV